MRTFSLFDGGEWENANKEVPLSFDDLYDALKEPGFELPRHDGTAKGIAAAKATLPKISAAKFSKGREVESSACLVFDADADPHLSPEALQERLDGVSFVAHTTSQSSPSAWRWRIFIETDRPMTKGEYRATWETVKKNLGFPVGEEAKDAGRLNYLPTKDRNYVAVRGQGEAVYVESEVKIVASPAVPLSPSRVPLERFEALGKAWPKKGRHAAQLALAGALIRDGYSREETIEALCAVCRIAGDEDRSKREKTVDSTLARGGDVTGWTTLKKYVDPAVVDRARTSPEAERVISSIVPKQDLPEPFIDWEDPEEPVEYLVDGMIATGSVSMFVAHGGSLKTWAALSMGMAICRGEAWLGKPTKKGKVVFVDFESGKKTIRNRVLKLGAYDLKGELGYLWSKKTLNDISFWDDLKAHGASLVVIDSLAAGTPGVDENSKDATNALFMATQFSEETGTAVLFVHHAKKDTGSDRRLSVRGHSSLFGACDDIYAFGEPIGSKDDLTSTIECIKSSGERPDPVEFNIRFEGSRAVARSESRKQTSSRELRSDNDLDARVRLEAGTGPVTTSGLSRKLGIRKDRIVNSVKALTEAGELRNTGKGYEADSYEKRKARILPLLESRLTVEGLSRAAGIGKTLLVSEFEGKQYAYDRNQGCHAIFPCVP